MGKLKNKIEKIVENLNNFESETETENINSTDKLSITHFEVSGHFIPKSVVYKLRKSIEKIKTED